MISKCSNSFHVLHFGCWLAHWLCNVLVSEWQNRACCLYGVIKTLGSLQCRSNMTGGYTVAIFSWIMILKRPSLKHISIEEQLLSHDINLVSRARKTHNNAAEILVVTSSEYVLKVPCGKQTKVMLTFSDTHQKGLCVSLRSNKHAECISLLIKYWQNWFSFNNEVMLT